MGTIKFRAWDDKTKQWMYTTPSAYKWYSKDKSFSFKKESSNVRFLVDETQFTGASDKHGLIYECDIVDSGGNVKGNITAAIQIAQHKLP